DGRSLGAGRLDVGATVEDGIAGGEVLDVGPDVAVPGGQAAGPEVGRLDHVVVDAHDPGELGGIVAGHLRLPPPPPVTANLHTLSNRCEGSGRGPGPCGRCPGGTVATPRRAAARAAARGLSARATARRGSSRRTSPSGHRACWRTR